MLERESERGRERGFARATWKVFCSVVGRDPGPLRRVCLGRRPQNITMPLLVDGGVDNDVTDKDWLFDFLLSVFKSPHWDVAVMGFIDENCAVFDKDEENKLSYTTLHHQFKDLVSEGLLRPTGVTKRRPRKHPAWSGVGRTVVLLLVPRLQHRSTVGIKTCLDTGTSYQ